MIILLFSLLFGGESAEIRSSQDVTFRRELADRLLAVSKKDGEYHARAGVAYLALGDSENADKCFQLANQYDSDDPETQVIIAMGNINWGDKNKGFEMLARTAEMASGHDDRMMVHIAWFYVQLGECEKAESLLKGAIKADPSDFDNLFEWAAMANQCGDKTTALRRVYQAINRDSDEARVMMKALEVISGRFFSDEFVQ